MAGSSSNDISRDCVMLKSFDVLDHNTEIFGTKILEASAGTGKTFAIEHLVVRNLLEAPSGQEPLLIDEILAITFTKAAAREIKIRIRTCIRSTIKALKNQEAPFRYLEKHLSSQCAIRQLEEALVCFDRAQIFTIHGFCQKMLSEFALDSRSLPIEGEAKPLGISIQSDLLDFLEKQRVLCPEQLECLVSKKKGVPSLCKALLHANAPSEETGDYLEDFEKLSKAIQTCPFTCDVFHEFERIESAYKKTNFSSIDFPFQLECLQTLFNHPTDELAIRRWLSEKKDLFFFLEKSNLKKGKEASSDFFDWCVLYIKPLLRNCKAPQKLFRRLRAAWQKPLEELQEKRSLFSPDYLLEQMHKSLRYPEFVSAVQRKYQAVVIDEFQDTDRLQWSIFSTLFQNKTRLFYLVGDPKQSIYRFRNADLYTYFQARASIEKEERYALDTNYRSSPELISALNDLFHSDHVEPWLLLPKEKRAETYRAVKAGIQERLAFDDDQSAIEFFQVKEMQEATIYAAEEILRLQPFVTNFRSFAILVKSRDEAREVQRLFQKLSIPSSAKTRSSLARSPALKALEEFFDALFFPKDIHCVKIFLTGPFSQVPIEQLMEHRTCDVLMQWKALLEQKGLPALFHVFFRFRQSASSSTLYEKIAKQGAEFFGDLLQIIERLLSLKVNDFEEIKRVFREIARADVDEESDLQRGADVEEDAVQIMTMHASKGLEFDVVFALGVASKTPKEDEDLEEAEAEKLRQLYVALTRAKRRLYIPLFEKKGVNQGQEAPIDLLWKRSKLESNPLLIVQKLSQINPQISLCPVEVALKTRKKQASSLPLNQPTPPYMPTRSGFIFSYSALAKPTQEGQEPSLEMPGAEKTLHSFPRGASSGNVFHRIFERFFTESRDLDQIIQEEIAFSSLREWREVIVDVVNKTLSRPLIEQESLFSLRNAVLRAEMEFFFYEKPHFLKGVIDLVLLREKRLYLFDWKTNWLGLKDEAYAYSNLEKAMDQHDYWLQASLYTEALKRAWPDYPVEKAIYLFIRGADAPSGGILSFQPKPFVLSL